VLDQQAADAEDDDASATLNADQPLRPGQTPAKGRPTPKRSEAEGRRRQPYSAPGDRKAAAQQSRDRGKTERQRRMLAMKRGEEWALPAKDKGPVRALARDFVDSRRSFSEYLLYVLVLLLLVAYLPVFRNTIVSFYVLLSAAVLLIAENWLVGRKVLRLATERYPGESVRGLRMYTAIRNSQMRRLRMPAPRRKPGEKI
jgi:hypothetical protein